MALRSVIMWTLFSVIVVFVLSTSVQAQELTDVPASDISKQIESGEDIYLENALIKGEFNLSKLDLKTIYGLMLKLKVVESEIKINNSVFENDVNMCNTTFRKTFIFIIPHFQANQIL